MSNQACWKEGPEQTHGAISHVNAIGNTNLHQHASTLQTKEVLGVLKHSKARLLYGHYYWRHVRRGGVAAPVKWSRLKGLNCAYMCVSERAGGRERRRRGARAEISASCQNHV